MCFDSIDLFIRYSFKTLHYGSVSKTGFFNRLIRVCELFAWERGQQSKRLCSILWPCAEKIIIKIHQKLYSEYENGSKL